ncbi:MAG TPA: winged helix-turn-helix domain-containing protein [Solirubrobacteraceae bacterium]|nr:winged helix-turn-helix domain-containing protein [Solirubrobacteraceae bacterium]
MSKPITEIDDPRLVKALAHPLRIRILGILEQRSATPKELAELLDVQLENLSYHVRTLRDFGFIKLERRRMVKGAVEHRYGIVARPRITAEVWQQLPALVREALDSASLGQIWDVVTRAATQNKMSRPESHMARRVARLDEQGFAEMSKVVGQTVDKLLEIEKQSAQRLRKHEGPQVPTVLIAMLFDAPDDDASDNGGRAGGAAHRSRRRATAHIGK